MKSNGEPWSTEEGSSKTRMIEMNRKMALMWKELSDEEK
jgi:hypothetical protein